MFLSHLTRKLCNRYVKSKDSRTVDNLNLGPHYVDVNFLCVVFCFLDLTWSPLSCGMFCLFCLWSVSEFIPNMPYFVTHCFIFLQLLLDLILDPPSLQVNSKISRIKRCTVLKSGGNYNVLCTDQKYLSCFCDNLKPILTIVELL